MYNNWKFNFLLFLISSFFFQISYSQPAYIKNKIKRNIERDIEQKVGEKHKERGREEIKKVSYENDTRYEDFYNKTPLTLDIEITEFNPKNNKVKSKITSKLVFGKQGECYVINANTKEESILIFNYKEKANYMVNPHNKIATKMPLINLQKMINATAKNAANTPENSESDGNWKRTNETKNINGHLCRKYIYTNNNNRQFSKYEAWVAENLNYNIDGNYILGSQLRNYNLPESNNPQIHKGYILESAHFDKNSGNISQEIKITNIKKYAEEQYFDLSNYQVNDILDGL